MLLISATLDALPEIPDLIDQDRIHEVKKRNTITKIDSLLYNSDIDRLDRHDQSSSVGQDKISGLSLSSADAALRNFALPVMTHPLSMHMAIR